MKHLVEALHTFRHLGIDFISYQENIDTGSPLGEALFTIISAMAQLERDIIRERVKAGLRKAREKGKKLGRPRVMRAPSGSEKFEKSGIDFAYYRKTSLCKQILPFRRLKRLSIKPPRRRLYRLLTVLIFA